MLKNNKNYNKQSQSLSNVKGVRDLDPETAANYSGGRGVINHPRWIPDVILYSEKNGKGKSIRINAATDDGIPNVGDGFNDLTSSVWIKRGAWKFYDDTNYNGENSPRQSSNSLAKRQSFTRGPGFYNLGANNNRLSSLKRIA